MSVKRQWLNALHVESPVRAVVETAEATAGEEMGAYLAFMAMRLIEMHRILKPTGSIYLHCDPTASHYLKLMMDAIFGRKNFRRELIWHLRGAAGFKALASNWVRGHDTLLFYARSNDSTFNKQWLPYDEKQLKRFTGLDEDGRRYKSITKDRRLYLDETKGIPATSVWSDVAGFQTVVNSKERLGYPTQKPLALLDRIIKASSNPGDVVLDPFCGCATACVAAEKLGRRWIGIDVSDLAILLCEERIVQVQNETGQTNFGIPYHDPIHRTDWPVRTDLPTGEKPIELPRRDVREMLWTEQDGRCNGCQRQFPEDFADLMDVDHIKPRSKGGQHTWENVQLLCRSCNVKKGNRSMRDLHRRLREEAERASA